MQSHAVKEEIGFVDDGIRNGNIAISGVKTVPRIAKELNTIAKPAFNLVIEKKEIIAPRIAMIGNNHKTGYFP